jgi:hypothetical protein
MIHGFLGHVPGFDFLLEQGFKNLHFLSCEFVWVIASFAGNDAKGV